MEALLNFLSTTIATQQFLQVFVGGCTMLLIAWMVTRARGDRDHAPATPSPVQALTDPPSPMATILREAVEILRETRDLLRRMAGDSERLRDCLRIIREHTERQTDLLDKIEREQSAENRSHRDRP
jgi:hypothetical protein